MSNPRTCKISTPPLTWWGRRFRLPSGILCAVGSVFAAALLAATPGDSAFSAERYLNHIKFLASPEMKGRESGSPELEKAAQYIAAQFKCDRLKPLDGKSYLQAFEVTTSAKLGKANRFDFNAESLQINKDYVAINFSARGKASGCVVFAGYGIIARYYNYDDYAGIDVHGKFVVVLAHEPQEYDQKSVFDGKVYTDHSQTYSKAANARKHGAAGVILVWDRVNHQTGSDQTGSSKEELEAFGGTS